MHTVPCNRIRNDMRIRGGKMNIIKYCDPGHGWYKVPRKLLQKLDIEDKISPYSYQYKDMTYLEEDCDADILLTALENKDIAFKIKQSHANRSSRIRNYDHYKQSTPTWK